MKVSLGDVFIFDLLPQKRLYLIDLWYYNNGN